ncbi:MAG: Cna B-type domain-containing protein, partial [Eggerthellaceae bacterium]|nr:Cna B-type domain-containing protein [Eggerthellaceae bacterium]
KIYADDGKGNPVQVTDLDTLDADHYKVRWYVFKNQSSAWHIDGKLVKKEGAIQVRKSFAGNANGIALAKQGFEITATNGKAAHSLTLSEGSFESYDPASDTYTWLVPGVEHGEQWTISEPYARVSADGESSYFSYADYRIVDAVNGTTTSGNSSQLEEGAASLSAVVSGQAYALDEDMDEILQVNFTNVYHADNSIIIKKEDSRTGNPLPGAVFQLWQGDSPMTFTYDGDTGQYSYAPDGGEGAVSDLSGSETGYYEIMVGGFSYDNGNIVVKETQAPAGYTPVENIEIGYLDSEGDSIGIVAGGHAAEYHSGLLVIPNGTNSMSVTAEKKWECPESEWEDVTVQLLANGRLASSLIPGVPATALLSSQSGYVHTWENLPTHANGAEIAWSIREVAIGDEPCRADYSFANWIVGYEPGVYTENAEGEVTNVKFVVTNDTKRTMLRLTKTDMSGSTVLPDATFKIEHLVESGDGYVADPSFVTRTQTTSASGVIVIDNLPYGYYRLTE